MRGRVLAAFALLVCVVLGGCAGSPHARVRFETSLGPFVLETLPEHAPATVGNFLAYVDSGYYNGLTMHRVAPGFVLQGGGLEADYKTRHAERPPIRLEASQDQPNLRWTVAMARQGPDTATSEFFVNLADNPALDPTGPGTGYAVFARVVGGFDVLTNMTHAEFGQPFLGPDDYFPKTPIVFVRVVRE